MFKNISRKKNIQENISLLRVVTNNNSVKIFLIMTNLYHFVPRSNGSNFLNKNYQVKNRIANCLTEFQHQGINFLFEHFENHTSCILNLESGLGKTALVTAFLDAVLPHDSSRKCLIIVKNDERIINWQFHLDVLTNLSSRVVSEEKEIGKESVYITKYDLLRSSTTLINISFDCIIVDDRDDLLADKICLAYLLRNFENKISLVISSHDVSIDLRQFHAILRLCGRLDSTYMLFKSFEDKFSLPRISGLPNDRNTLDSLFRRHEKIINFCRDFCLRRYRHQFEAELPLCQPDVYKQSIKRWQETNKQFQFHFFRKPITISNRNSLRSCQNLISASERDTEELFKSFLSKKEEDELNAEVTRITTIASENDSNESSHLDNVLMSPLLFVPDTEDDKLEETVSSTTKDDDNRNIIQPTPIRKNIINSVDKRRQKRLKEQNNNEITTRITRGMERLTRSKAQKSKYFLLDIETIMKKDSSINKALKKRTKNQIVKKNKGTKEIDDVIRVSSTISTPQINKKSKQGRKKQAENIFNVDDECLFNGQQFGGYINEVEFIENNNNNNNNNNNINANNYLNCIYETQCDFSVDHNLILPDTSEIKIMSQSEPTVITLSSSSDSSIDFRRNKKNNRRISSSPDLFSTYDEYNITCSQKNNQNKKKMEYSKKTNNNKSCLDILENNLKTSQLKSSHINKFSSTSTELQNTTPVDCIDLVNEETPRIDNSIMDRNLLVQQRSNSNFFQQTNKITKYFCNNDQITTTNISDTSQSTSSNLPVTVEYPKTPKRKTSERSTKINSISKKSPNTKSTPTTPNSIRNWLITTPTSKNSNRKATSTTQVNDDNTKKRRRLDKLF